MQQDKLKNYQPTRQLVIYWKIFKDLAINDSLRLLHHIWKTHPVSSLKGSEPENPGRDLIMDEGTVGFEKITKKIIRWIWTHFDILAQNHGICFLLTEAAISSKFSVPGEIEITLL